MPAFLGLNALPGRVLLALVLFAAAATPASAQTQGKTMTTASGLQITDTKVGTQNFSFDNAGRVTSFTDPMGRATGYTRDSAGYVTQKTFPDGATQLQFKVLQTYSNGAVDRWIEPWPAGQPEPERPAPVLAVEGATPGQSTSPTAITREPTRTSASR